MANAPKARRFGRAGWLAVVLSLGALLLPGANVLRAQEATNRDSATDFNSFQIIAQRNIFDPTRSGRVRSYGSGRRRPAAQSFAFCGIGEAALGKQHYAAMFNGYGNPGRQLYEGDVINGFKIVQIPPPAATNGWRACVQLAATNQATITLFEGMGMRREEGGAWTVSEQTEPNPVELATTSDTPTKTSDGDADSSSRSSSSANSSTSDSDVIKRLKLQREQEDK
jgi:hypothetical protein